MNNSTKTRPLTDLQATVLDAVSTSVRLPASYIAERAEVSRSAARSALDALERRGLVVVSTAALSGGPARFYLRVSR